MPLTHEQKGRLRLGVFSLQLTLLIGLVSPLTSAAAMRYAEVERALAQLPSQGICLPVSQRLSYVVNGLAPAEAEIAAQNSPGATSVLDVDIWEQRFLTIWDQEHEALYDEWSKGEDGFWHYFLAYGIDGNMAMYEATGDQRYLDRALYYVNNMIATARPSSTLQYSKFRDTYLGWSSIRDELGEVPMRESFAWRYVTQLLVLIRETPVLYNDPFYRLQYDSILEFSEEHIFEKWYSRGERHIFRVNTNMTAHWAFITMNLAMLTEDDERRDLYVSIYTRINDDLRAQLMPNPEDETAYFWNSRWDVFDRPGQDTTHANHVLAYIVEAYDRGLFWTDADITQFRNLLVNVLWNGSLTSPSFNGYVDGSEPEGGSFQSDGFLKLARYFPEVLDLYANYMSQRSYLTQFYGHAALSAHLLAVNGCLD